MARLTAHRIHKHISKIPGWKGMSFVDGIDALDAASLARFEALDRMRRDETFEEAGRFAAEYALGLSEGYRRRMVEAQQWATWLGVILFTLAGVAISILWLGR